MSEKNIHELNQIIADYSKKSGETLPNIQLAKETKDLGLFELFEQYSNNNPLDPGVKELISELISQKIEEDLMKENPLAK